MSSAWNSSGGLDGGQHNLLAITSTALGGDDTTDGNFSHVGSGRAHAAQGHNFVVLGEPEVDGCLVVAVKVLVYTVLLHDEYLAPYAKQLVELIGCQLFEGFLMQL